MAKRTTTIPNKRSTRFVASMMFEPMPMKAREGPMENRGRCCGNYDVCVYIHLYIYTYGHIHIWTYTYVHMLKDGSSSNNNDDNSNSDSMYG